MSEKLNKIDNGFIKLCFFWQKNQILLKTKNSTILVIFQMISLKLKKKIINQFLLTGEKCMPGMHLKQP